MSDWREAIVGHADFQIHIHYGRGCLYDSRLFRSKWVSESQVTSITYIILFSGGRRKISSFDSFSEVDVNASSKNAPVDVPFYRRQNFFRGKDGTYLYIHPYSKTKTFVSGFRGLHTWAMNGRPCPFWSHQHIAVGWTCTYLGQFICWACTQQFRVRCSEGFQLFKVSKRTKSDAFTLF